MKKYILILSFIVTQFSLLAQIDPTLINIHSLKIKPSTDSIFLDSLSVVQSSLMFYDKNNNPIKGLDYIFDFEKSVLIFSSLPDIDTLIISYKTFPINFFEPVFLFDRSNFLVGAEDDQANYKYVFNQEDYKSSFSQSSLSRKGSISRGISFGNAQDVIVNSSLNLQLDGKLNNDLFITAAISDNNIPIQPDGTSQQLQEFDKVFIKLYNDNFSLIAGDFELKKPRGYFLNYYKKAQGAEIKYNTGFKTKSEKNVVINTSVSGAVAKGKLQRQELKAVEGNQGPYRLTGTNNETFIIVLAGTEKVYIDGMLLRRGTENDYVIDYNLGEIVFTSNQPINKDKRIIVEFEYSDRNYTRFLVTTSNEIKIGKSEFWLNIYDESDNKNQAFDQTLTTDDRALLAGIGDNLNMAIVPGYDSLEFESAEIRYALIDSIVDGVLYDSIFIYSTNPDFAFYRISFSLVGPNKGNYKKGVSAANGRVYEWVAPVNGVPQGDYIPFKKIITPKKNQVISLGGLSKITDKTILNFEFAYSNTDVNTFSKLDSKDDKGYAAKIGVEQQIIKTKNTQFGANISYGFIERNFQAIENFRETEFTRNWNLESIYPQNNENLVNAELFLLNKKIGNSSIGTSYINRGAEYSGLQNNASTKLRFGTWNISGVASLLTSESNLYNTEFLRHSVLISKDLWRLNVGIKEISERNIWNTVQSDSITLNSFNFNQLEAFVSNSDSTKNKYFINYKYRSDELPKNNMLEKSTVSQDISVGTTLISKSKSRLSTVFNYRQLRVMDSSLYHGNSENNMTGKAEYSFRLFKGAISSSTLYEIGSGLERKTEFSYIEVAPGQGVFAWTDYNGNGIQELDEFELANFIDEASFIRVLIPTTDYIKTYSNQFNQSLKISPEVAWRFKTGIRKFISRFSDQFAYRISQKNTSSELLEYANPFNTNVDETQLVNLNSSIRNSFSLNRGKPGFGIDYIIQTNNSKILLVSGFDTRTNFNHNLLLRYNQGKIVSVQNNSQLEDKTYSSEFFTNKDYNIEILSNESQLNIQPNLNNRITLKYEYKNKNNIAGGEILDIHDAGLEYRLSSVSKGALSATFNYIYYDYNAATNTAIAYEMLQGLMPGSNLTWSVNFQRQLANGLQINLNYNARKSQDAEIIHTGGVQLRAFF
ncbi:MAG: hypothetical protein PHP52_11355 [Bacteroidales bacterium]|nr:hypothetical protein [Bacteroidales bacterium]